MAGGKVYLVGAGPGDPGLITVRGLEVLRACDGVVYDRLVAPELVDEAPAAAARFFAGKEPGHHHLAQSWINELLIELARRGQTVVRLKGGDPFVFGRGGEEADALAAAGIPFEVVPGVSSAVAVPAYAGIPVTHRGVASSYAVVTAHQSDDPHAAVDWAALATGVDTLVLLMGVTTLTDVARRLIEAGRDPDQPAALVESGTTHHQRTLIATLGTIAEVAERAAVRPPTTIVIGEVVALHDRIGWFESREDGLRGPADRLRTPR